MKPVLKRKIIAILTAGSLLFNVYSVAKLQQKIEEIEKGYSNSSQKNNATKLPVSSMPKEKITGKVDLTSKKKRLDDDEIDINL